MQPIERYGVAALLFLIATIGAVVLWDQTESDALPDQEVKAAVEKPAKKWSTQNTHTPPKDIANNLLAAIDSKKTAAKGGRINLNNKPDSPWATRHRAQAEGWVDEGRDRDRKS